ncbi:MAG: PglY protein, partial [Pseudonocardiaceae bacterium]
MTAGELFLRDVLDIPESVHAGDFKVELSGGFRDTQARVDEYVVTDQLRQAFGRALGVVHAAVRNDSSYAAYLHGSFGSGKSHFLTVLHAILNNDPVARAKLGLQSVIADHDDWLRGRRFLMVPYHLVGATDVGSALLGGYVKTVRELHPEAPVPPVYRADAMLADAGRQRAFLADDDKFVEWLGSGAPEHTTPADLDDLDVIDAAEVSGWTCAELDRSFAAPAGDPLRDGLVSALLSGPMSAYARGASGDKDAFIPLEDGLSVISRHAEALGYDGLILFLDELILWLQAHLSDQQFVNTQVSKLVKLIESGEADRAVPIVSFISRQRDLSQLVGQDVVGSDVKNLEAQVQYLAGRFDTVTLEDRNLPAIIKERVLTPRSAEARTALDAAFTEVESAGAAVKDVLLDAGGATGADWADFRAVYPLSPALLNVLVALAGVLQRQRTGLKLLQDMLHRRRDDLRLGQLIPLGDLWDALGDGTGEAFTDRLRKEAEAANRCYAKVRGHLLEKYGSAEDERFRADDRFVKTLLLAALAPDVPALTRLTGARLAALNHGSIRSRTVPAGSMVVSRLREIQADFGELRADGEEDPVFTLHLSDLDIEPLLDMVGEQDSLGARRIWVKDQLWSALEIRDTGEFVCEREIVWKGTRRTAEFVFANVRDTQDLPDLQFSPSVEGRIRFLLDYPFDIAGRHPSDDAGRVHNLIRDGVQAATIVWLPHFLSPQKSAQLGRLLKICYLLERDRLEDYAANLPADDRIRVRHQLQAQRDNLTSQLAAVLQQLYGIAKPDDANLGSQVGTDGHVLSLYPGHRPTLLGGAGFEHNVLTLTDGLFDLRYPKHPNFDPTGSRRPVTLGELKTALTWISRALEDGDKRVV